MSELVSQKKHCSCSVLPIVNRTSQNTNAYQQLQPPPPTTPQRETILCGTVKTNPCRTVIRQHCPVRRQQQPKQYPMNSQSTTVLLLCLYSIFLLLFCGIGTIPLCEAFSNYLLSDSNCWTELSTDEVIMNHPVVPAMESDDPDMRIVLVHDNEGTTTDTSNSRTMQQQQQQHPDGRIGIDQFPATVSLKVITSETSKTNLDYQWAMDVVTIETNQNQNDNTYGGHFVQGSCPNQHRVAGRASTTTVQLVVENAGTKIVAAWATSHEAVRLTPVVEFVALQHEALSIEDTKYADRINPEQEIVVDQNDNERKYLERKLHDPIREYNIHNRARMHDVGIHHDEEHAHSVAAAQKLLIEDAFNKRMEQIEDRHDENMRRNVDGVEEKLNRLITEHNIHPHKQEMHHKMVKKALEWKKEQTLQEQTISEKREHFKEEKTKKMEELLSYDIGFDVYETLSLASFLHGAFLLIGGTITLTYACLWASRRGNKGRRDL